jgi:hypothetical protein
MKITKEAVKAWKAEYDLDNEWEREELKARLRNETIEQSVKSYFELCRFMVSLSRSYDEPAELQSLRAKEYEELFTKWEILSRRLTHVAKPTSI